MNLIEQYKQSRESLFQKFEILPNSKFITVNHPVRQIHYLKMGNGKPVVLLHGGGSHSSEWVSIVKQLAQHFQLFIPDQPGFGLNDPFDYSTVNYRQNGIDFLHSFMDTLDLDRAYFVANSTGGFHSINYALKHPKRVEKLILIGAPAGINMWVPLPLRLMGLKPVNKFIMKTVARPTIGNIIRFHRNVVVADVSGLSPEYLKHTRDHMLLKKDTFLNLFENILNFEGWKKEYFIGNKLSQLQIPVRFIWGSEDVFESPDSGKKKAAVVRDYRFEVVEDAGHCPWLEQQEKCVNHIVSMIRN